MQLTVLSYIFSFCFPLSETFQLSIQVLYMYILVILILICRIDIRTRFALLYSVYFLRLSFIICSVFADLFFRCLLILYFFLRSFFNFFYFRLMIVRMSVILCLLRIRLWFRYTGCWNFRNQSSANVRKARPITAAIIFLFMMPLL